MTISFCALGRRMCTADRSEGPLQCLLHQHSVHASLIYLKEQR